MAASKTEPVKQDKSPLRVGIIGCGRATNDLHLPALQRVQQGQAVAVSDIDTDRMQEVANRFQITHPYRDYEALLADQEIEAVAVCVPPRFHTEVALAALDAGKHVLIEKPLALTLEDCDRLIEGASRSDRKVMVGFNYRHHPFSLEARQMIHRGDFGQVEAIRSLHTNGRTLRQGSPGWHVQRRQGGGLLFEIAPHHLDMWRYLPQVEIEEIYAIERLDEHGDVAVSVLAQAENGIQYTATFSTVTSENSTLEILTHLGFLRLTFYRLDGMAHTPAGGHVGGVRARLLNAKQRLRAWRHWPWAFRKGGIMMASYEAEWRRFVEAIRNDAPVTCTLEDGRRALQLTLSAIESAATGQPVKVNQVQRKAGLPAKPVPVQDRQ